MVSMLANDGSFDQHLPAVTDSSHDHDDARRWSFNQARQWADRTGINGLGDKFQKHRIAGDVLFAVDPPTFCLAMGLTGPHKAAFLTKLRALYEANPSNDNYLLVL